MDANPAPVQVTLHTSLGAIDIELWPKEAPKAVRNFVQLCMEGYYDGSPFHRWEAQARPALQQRRAAAHSRRLRPVLETRFHGLLQQPPGLQDDQGLHDPGRRSHGHG
jgi:hypothetical protein